MKAVLRSGHLDRFNDPFARLFGNKKSLISKARPVQRTNVIEPLDALQFLAFLRLTCLILFSRVGMLSKTCLLKAASMPPDAHPTLFPFFPPPKTNPPTSTVAHPMIGFAIASHVGSRPCSMICCTVIPGSRGPVGNGFWTVK